MSKKATSSVIAVCHQGDQFQAVECHRHGDGIEVRRLWQAEGSADQWERFARTCGMSTPLSSGSARADRRRVIVGLDSLGLMFTQLEIPDVGSTETEAMIRMQLETRLPLEPAHMQWGWRKQSRDRDLATILVVAGRKRSLQQQPWLSLQPDRILLNAEALVRVWQEVFEIHRTAGIVISVNAAESDVCVAQEGQLVHAAVLDVGALELADGGHEGVERLIRDLQRVVGSVAEELPITILSDGSARWDDLAGTLRQSGFQARAVMPDERRLHLADDVQPADLYQGRVALGLALLALDPNVRPLQLLPARSLEEPQAAGKRPGMSLATAAVLLVLAGILWAAVNVGTLTWRKHRLEPLVNDPQVQTWLTERAARKTTARYRPDLLTLLKTVNGVKAEGIVLNDWIFKRGQPVRITGEAKKSDSLYKFEEALNACKDIRNAVIEEHEKEKRGRKITFSLTFDYKNITQKSARY